VTIIMERGTDS